jgi:hypothetical protein
LYVSDTPLDFLAWKSDLGDQSLPALTWQSLNKVPPVVVGMAAFMGGVYWTFNRRKKLAIERALEEGKLQRPDNAGEVVEGVASSTSHENGEDNA